MAMEGSLRGRLIADGRTGAWSQSKKVTSVCEFIGFMGDIGPYGPDWNVKTQLRLAEQFKVKNTMFRAVRQMERFIGATSNPEPIWVAMRQSVLEAPLITTGDKVSIRGFGKLRTVIVFYLSPVLDCLCSFYDRKSKHHDNVFNIYMEPGSIFLLSLEVDPTLEDLMEMSAAKAQLLTRFTMMAYVLRSVRSEDDVIWGRGTVYACRDRDESKVYGMASTIDEEDPKATFPLDNNKCEVVIVEGF
ncbi:hypothetical protein BJ508DRAFT_334039 [Ascobolus immersus RN42]|uniref:Uncharacterized protein n=1 Tax=Ascobolus immersus RN42 TaxID=1160509 RepID=A0A3N4HHF4_ASCIM|nr:hypothetical protein BJ508DRAFT_334039 [Ascobolus immersus RN42]